MYEELSIEQLRSVVAQRDSELKEAQRVNGQLKEEVADYQSTFDLRNKADQRAIQQWQEAHPGKEAVWPDHADLVCWLMERLKNPGNEP